MYIKPKNATKTRNGSTVKYYKPEKSNRNKWYFANLQESFCKQIYDIGQDYYKRMQDTKNRPRHRIKNPASLVKVLYWLALTGARQQECFSTRFRPTMEIMNKDGGTYIIIQHLNQKHGSVDNLKLITATIPVMDEWEQSMWEFITDGGLVTNADQIFKYDQWASIKKNRITELFKKNFKINLKDTQGKLHKGEGLCPHILRHMRAYNVLITHKIPREMAMAYFGWDKYDMLYYYVHINKMLVVSDQLDILRRNNLLSNLRIDSAIQLLAEKPFSTGR